MATVPTLIDERVLLDAKRWRVMSYLVTVKRMEASLAALKANVCTPEQLDAILAEAAT